ncbi:hypothetical protein F4810DRAFT_708526 [Camillea tinctor]|nr:hypothetical protein F4810DRAFT_708526 [Camillea tinctor]
MNSPYAQGAESPVLNAIGVTAVPPKRASGEAKREFRFARDQVWIQAAKSFNFVDETQEVVNIHETSDQDASDTETAPTKAAHQSPIVTKQETYRPQSASLDESSSVALSPERSGEPVDVEHPKKKRALSLGSSIVSITADVTDLLAQSSMTLDCLDADPSLLSNENNPGLQLLLGVDDPLLCEIYPEKPIWPLRDKQEANLFTHYINHIAPLFDLCDHERHFAYFVPQRAPSCPLLLNAIMAVSAKHLSRKGQMDPLVVDKYYQNCLKTLIPALSSVAAVIDENLLAAIVLLRYMEEMELPFSTMGPQSHLIGTRVFIAAQEKTCDFSGLRLATFWLALRQEVFMAFIHSRPVHPDFFIRDITPSLQSSSCDCSYANRVIVHCAACLEYCFGEREQSSTVWTELVNFLDNWFADRPWQFYPICPEEEETQGLFPRQMFITSAVVMGMQHFYLARLILEAHNPKTPRIGPARKMALDDVNTQVKKYVRIICGIAEANPHIFPSYVCASISIAMAGDRFLDSQEQEALYAILVTTGKLMAFSTESAQADMRKAWGWTDTAERHQRMTTIAEILNTSI